MAEEGRSGLSGAAQAAIITGCFGLLTVVLTNWDRMPWNRAGPVAPLETARPLAGTAATPPNPSAASAAAAAKDAPLLAEAATRAPAAPPAENVVSATGYADADGARDAPGSLRLYARAVGRLAADGNPRCTAFLVSDNLAVTASFCVPDTPAELSVQFDATSAPVRATLVESSGQPAGAVRGVPDALTYAVLRLDGAPGATRGWLRLAPDAPTPGAAVAVIGGALRREIARDCAVVEVKNNVLRHDCDPGPGGGGAPIVARANRQVVGFHAYAGGADRSAKYGVRADRLTQSSARLAGISAE